MSDSDIDDSNQLTLQKDEERATEFARYTLQPNVQAAVTLDWYNTFKDVAVTALSNAMAEEVQATVDGDLQRAEEMLTAQAYTLDAIYNNLAGRAARARDPKIADQCLRTALRAQAQSRTTWEAVWRLKNLPVMGYVRQANIAHGPQQVNNAVVPPSDCAQAGSPGMAQNELKEEVDGEKRMDPGTASTPGAADPTMAPVGAVDGTDDDGRKSRVLPKRLEGRNKERPA